MANQLTDKQEKVLKYIKTYIAKSGHGPTQEEIKRNFGFSAVSTVHDYLKALEAKGAITRHAGKWSGIEVRDNWIPLVGKVAAGRPLEYLKQDEKVEVPTSMLKGSGPYFALQVVGDSMINEGILEDDYVIIRKQDNAENGQIVVALIENEATIKRFVKKKTHVELHSANEKYAPIVVKPSRHFQLAGVFCGLIRQV